LQTSQHITRKIRVACLALTCLFFSSRSQALDWSKEAVRLTGESQAVRERAIRRLRKMPHLKELLRREIHGDHLAQALDVIATLELRDLLLDLLQFGTTDATGSVYSAINSLLNEKNLSTVLLTYRKRLLCDSTCQASPAAQVVILDTLARAGLNISADELTRLFNSSQYEVKSSTLDYVRSAIITHGQIELLPLVQSALHTNPWQLRLQSWYLVSELPPQIRIRLKISKEECAQEQNVEVRETCLGFLKDKT
jgi:hypothetical protein